MLSNEGVSRGRGDLPTSSFPFLLINFFFLLFWISTPPQDPRVECYKILINTNLSRNSLGRRVCRRRMLQMVVLQWHGYGYNCVCSDLRRPITLMTLIFHNGDPFTNNKCLDFTSQNSHPFTPPQIDAPSLCLNILCINIGHHGHHELFDGSYIISMTTAT